jgi:hypothetical protein
MSDQQCITIPDIKLEWSEWHRWEEVNKFVRDGGAQIPSCKGVYEVRRPGASGERLTIGKASDLRWRIRQALVRGIGPHSSGNLIREHEKEILASLEIRWAATDRPAAAEEDLHRQYKSEIGDKLPIYTKRT